ncbi:hypothetical protein DPEC_G00019160 [Dallia pectoralis]|uniref:Uncharacterized protein n=1 Tax=Dallia pectoralis TaxID=75939 RepID=A0ACC2HFL8_DALPE|nr:hypothetical protein DPEC_G00019160 [Dallia pectoralis]
MLVVLDLQVKLGPVKVPPPELDAELEQRVAPPLTQIKVPEKIAPPTTLGKARSRGWLRLQHRTGTRAKRGFSRCSMATPLTQGSAHAGGNRNPSASHSGGGGKRSSGQVNCT